MEQDLTATQNDDGTVEVQGRRYESLRAFLELNPAYYPLQQKVDAVDDAIETGWNRAIAPLTELDRRTREIQQFLADANDEERARMGRRSLKVQLALIVGILAWVRIGAPIFYGVGNTAQSFDEKVTGAIATDTGKTVPHHSTIAGFPTTEGFLPCKNPSVTTADCRTWEGYPRAHLGADVSTPTGTPLYAIGQPDDTVTVTCSGSPSSKSGYGLLAQIEVSSLPDVEFRAGHLSKCQSGEFKPGQIFARTGNSGYSTGAHLHWEERHDGKAIDPQWAWVWFALKGDAPQPTIAIEGEESK